MFVSNVGKTELLFSVEKAALIHNATINQYAPLVIRQLILYVLQIV
ncbi:MAG: hypothetical protein SH818_19395 [Saprospiraceae bacterium]|nr:hypothetical protein [Saprospiraceae bacterium]